MSTTEPISPTASGHQASDDLYTEVLPVFDTVFVAGPPVLLVWAGTVLFALMLAGPFALLAMFVLVVVAAAALVTLAGAILASPYLLVRHLRARLAEREVSGGDSVTIGYPGLDRVGFVTAATDGPS
jgi:hypothetical protein